MRVYTTEELDILTDYYENGGVRTTCTTKGEEVAEEKAASKNDQEKADVALIPQVALVAAAKAFQVGEKKYGRYNFYKGHKASQLISAMLRHATAWMEGEENDPADGQPHLGSVIACAAMILQQQKLGTLKDNRYKEESNG